ncbi:MAG: hypothetical protein JXB49_29515 [Bacteroidales bacterium]|nr:hypothetical protein [Bacteroidales bacterium]
MKTNIISIIYMSIIAIFLIFRCENSTYPKSNIITKEKISGYVQKGPFINGSGITINELDEDLSQTGKVFNTQIADNKGGFEVNNIELASNYVCLRADGFYFNEILGEQSKAQITLYALSDVSDKNTINVNIITHLEKSRIEYLLSNGFSFDEAKQQAQSDILAIFNIRKTDIASSDLLDISEQGDGNAILLAISLILQGYRSEGELTELLSNISTDIKEDGKLNSSSLGSQLINHVVYLDTLAIRNNLEKRYSDLGVTASIPNFEAYLRNFIEGTSFPITESLIEYPSLGLYGKNILALNDTSYSGEYFSLAANLTKGTSLKVKITALKPYLAMDIWYGIWYYAVGSGNNWSITAFDYNTKTQFFTAIESDRSCDLKMLFDQGRFLIEYFEMNSAIPTRTKTITKY